MLAAAAAVQTTGLCKKDKERTAAEVTDILVNWPWQSSLPWEFHLRRSIMCAITSIYILMKCLWYKIGFILLFRPSHHVKYSATKTKELEDFKRFAEFQSE